MSKEASNRFTNTKEALKHTLSFVKENPKTTLAYSVVLMTAGGTAYAAYNLYLLIKHLPQR